MLQEAVLPPNWAAMHQSHQPEQMSTKVFVPQALPASSSNIRTATWVTAPAPKPPIAYPVVEGTTTSLLPYSELLSTSLESKSVPVKPSGGGMFGMCKKTLKTDSQTISSSSSMPSSSDSTWTSSTDSVALSRSSSFSKKSRDEQQQPTIQGDGTISSVSDVNSRYFAIAREGPTKCPAHIQMSHPDFASSAPSPLMLYYYDETAPNPVLLNNDVKGEHPLENARKQWTYFWTGTSGKDEEYSTNMQLPTTNNSFASSSAAVGDVDDDKYSSIADPRRGKAGRGACCGPETSSGGSYTSSGESSSYVESSISSISSSGVHTNHRPPRSGPLQTDGEDELVRGSVQVAKSQSSTKGHSVVPRKETSGKGSRTRGPTLRLQQQLRRCCKPKANGSVYSSFSKSTESKAVRIVKYSQDVPRIYVSAPSPMKTRNQLFLPNAIQSRQSSAQNVQNKNQKKFSGSSHMSSSPNEKSTVTGHAKKLANRAGCCQNDVEDAESVYSSSTCSSISTRRRSAEHVVRRTRCPKCGYLELEEQQKRNSNKCCSKNQLSSVASLSMHMPQGGVQSSGLLSTASRRIASSGVERRGSSNVGRKETTSTSLLAASSSSSSVLTETQKKRRNKGCCNKTVDEQSMSQDLESGPIENRRLEQDPIKAGKAPQPVMDIQSSSSGYSPSVSDTYSSSSTEPAPAKSETEKNLGYQIKKMYFNIEEMGGAMSDENVERPVYSVSYKNYPVICYDTVIPNCPQDFFRERQPPIKQ